MPVAIGYCHGFATVDAVGVAIDLFPWFLLTVTIEPYSNGFVTVAIEFSIFFKKKPARVSVQPNSGYDIYTIIYEILTLHSNKNHPPQAKIHALT